MATTSLLARSYGLLFLIAFALSVVMLATDQNLRTDFHTVTSGYYAHWYVVLVTAVADLFGGLLLLGLGTRTAVKGGVVGSGLLVVLFVGDVATYHQVGFQTAGDFADYLFGITYYGGDIRYLYDALLAVYVVAFLVGLLLLWSLREPPEGAPATAPGP